MKLRTLVFIIPVLLVSLSGLTLRKKRDKVSPLKYLELYGEMVYQRESCSNCHTFNVDSATNKLLSLDGVGSKYHSSWFYAQLMDPTYVIPTSTKPAYDYLWNKPLDFDEYSKFLQNEHNDIEYKAIEWGEVFEKSDSISQELKYVDFPVEAKSEAIALVSFLKSIEPSKNQQEIDSLEVVDEERKEDEWQELLNDTSSILYSKIGQDKGVVEGKSLFQINCSVCHGNEGRGMIGPDLTDEVWLFGGSPKEVANTIVNGAKPKCPSWKSSLNHEEVGSILAYLLSLSSSGKK